MQIVQESIRYMRLRMVPDAEFGPESRSQIEQLVRLTFGNEMKYDLELVDNIPQEPSGKYRFCISKVAHEFMQSTLS